MTSETDQEDGQYRAATTNIQARALAAHLQPDTCIRDLTAYAASHRMTAGTSRNASNTHKWLANAWNTERLLRSHIGGDPDLQRFAVQWAYPQAYYACFSHVLAVYSLTGQTEHSHRAVIRKQGSLAKAQKLPKYMCVYADGGMNALSVHGLNPGHYPSTLHFDQTDSRSVDHQLAQLLRSTRKIMLKQKKDDLRLRTQRGGLRRNYRAQDWDLASDKLGPTSLLAYLYRKRIKANYRDIDSLLREDIDGHAIFNGLVRTVAAFAYWSEFLLYSLGTQEDHAFLHSSSLAQAGFVATRKSKLDEI